MSDLNVVAVAQPQFKPIITELQSRQLPKGVHLHVISSEMLNDPNQRAHISQALANADIIFGEPLSVKEQMNDGTVSKLRWVQLIMAGVDKALSYTQVSQINYKVTRAGGESFGPHMTEYVIGVMLNHERHISYWLSEQVNHRWKTDPMYTYRSLHGLTVGILGASGSIGETIAKHCSYFGMKCRGLSSSKSAKHSNHEHIKQWFYSERPDSTKPAVVPPAFFHDLDYLVSVLPSTEATRGILEGDVLSACRPDPTKPPRTTFINIGRGDVCSDDTILRALIGSNHAELMKQNANAVGEDRWLQAAILDVFNTEPLPADHRFYKLAPPLLAITPHVSGMSSAAKTEIVDLFIENLNRFINSEPLLYELDRSRGY